MSVDRTKRAPQLAGVKVAEGVMFRVYCPPRPLDGGELELDLARPAADGGPIVCFRDWKIASVDFGADGTMVLHSVIKTGEAPDLRPEAEFGAKIEEWTHTIAAVIDNEGRLRAESVFVPNSPDGGVN